MEENAPASLCVLLASDTGYSSVWHLKPLEFWSQQTIELERPAVGRQLVQTDTILSFLDAKVPVASDMYDASLHQRWLCGRNVKAN